MLTAAVEEYLEAIYKMLQGDEPLIAARRNLGCRLVSRPATRQLFCIDHEIQRPPLYAQLDAVAVERLEVGLFERRGDGLARIGFAGVRRGLRVVARGRRIRAWLKG